MATVTRVVVNRSVLSGPRTSRPLQSIPSIQGKICAAKISRHRTSAAGMADPRTSEKDTPMQKEHQEFPGNVRTRAPMASGKCASNPVA